MGDEDEGPESDPYCAHWESIFREQHAPVPCDACGHSCHDHPALEQRRCRECDCAGFVSATAPATDD